MATKYGKVVTHLEGLPPINSYNPLKCICKRSRDRLKTYLDNHNSMSPHDGVTWHAPLFKLFYITQKLAKLVSRNFVTFPKNYLTTFIQ